MNFYIGQDVTWQTLGQSYTRTRRGKVVALVPANQAPQIPRGYKIAPGSFGGHTYRDHESYIVAVDNLDVFWPQVSSLMVVDKAKELAREMSDFVNGIQNKVGDIVDELSGEHRTLQQGITRFCVAWLERCDKMHKDCNYDGRNQASAELGMKFVARMTPQERAMPFI